MIPASSTSNVARRIAIIGGGFSGSLLSVHLLRGASARQPLEIMLVEREPARVSRGFAYSTPHGSCLLNVPAGRMSAFEEDRDHFVRWAQSRDPRISGASFVPRRLYGDYIADLLDDSRRAYDAHARFSRISSEATQIGPDSLKLNDGTSIPVERIVLAVGNLPPCDPPGANEEFLGGSRYIRNPWAPDALDSLQADQAVLLLGTGLTMLDVALVLHDRGFRQPIHAISRRGLLPQPHRASENPPPTLPMPESMRMSHSTPRKLLRALRDEIRSAYSRGIDWREIITSLRHDTPHIWQSLDERGRRQFLRHLLPYWETHRHRSAPTTAARTAGLRASGQLQIQAARITRIEMRPRDVQIRLRPRGTELTRQLHVGAVINCTGPDTNLLRSGGALLCDAIERGLVVPDPLGLGLLVARDGAVIDRQGVTSENVFALGPLRKAQLWETTAVPELRVQVRALGERLLK